MIINASVECKELIDIGECDKGFISNPSNYECECYGSWLVSRKSLVNKLVECSFGEECTENFEETRLVEINLTECKHILAHCTLCSFQYFLQLMLELSLLWLVLKKRCYLC